MKVIMKLPLLLLILSAFSGFSSANVVEPREVIDDRYQSLFALIENNTLVAGMPEEQLLDLMEQELAPVVDFPRIARKVMGKFSRQASDEQLTEFTTVFKRTLINTYAKGLNHLDQLDRVDIDHAVFDKKGRRAKVSSVVILKGGQKYRVVYSLYLKDQKQWLVENIVVEGINIGIVFRNQFAHYMEQYGQDVDKVISNWGQ